MTFRNVFACFLVIILGISFSGCWNKDNNDTAALSSLSESPTIENSVGMAKSVGFNIYLPGKNVSANLSSSLLAPSIRATEVASVTVNFKLTLINVGNVDQPTIVLQKTVSVNADGSAEVTFSFVPALTCIGEISITNGNIASYSDFIGATDLVSGADNNIDLAPKNSHMIQEVTAETISRLLADNTAFSKVLPSLATKVNLIIKSLDFTNETVYDQAFSEYQNWFENFAGQLKLETEASYQPFSLVTLIGGSLSDVSGENFGLIEDKLVPVEVLADGRLRFVMPYMSGGLHDFQLYLNGATQTVPINVVLLDAEEPANVIQNFLTNLENDTNSGTLAEYSSVAKELEDDFKNKVNLLSEAEKAEVAEFLKSISEYSTISASVACRKNIIVTEKYFLNADDYVVIKADIDEINKNIVTLDVLKAKIGNVSSNDYELNPATSEKIKDAILAGLKPVELSVFEKLRNILSARLREIISAGEAKELRRTGTIGVRGNIRAEATDSVYEFLSGREYITEYSVLYQSLSKSDIETSELGLLLPQWLNQFNVFRTELVSELPVQTILPTINIDDLFPTELQTTTKVADPSMLSISILDNPKVQGSIKSEGSSAILTFTTSEITPQNFTYVVAYKGSDGFNCSLPENGKVILPLPKLVEITLTPSSIELNSGKVFNLNEVAVVAKYDDNSTKIVTDVSWSGVGVSGSSFTANADGCTELNCEYSENGVSIAKALTVNFHRFSRDSEGVITDFLYNRYWKIIWVVEPEGIAPIGLCFDEAQAAVDKLGGDWRIPSVEELKSLYSDENPHIDSIFDYNENYPASVFGLWSEDAGLDEAYRPIAWRVFFDFGGWYVFTALQSDSGGIPVAVRSF